MSVTDCSDMHIDQWFEKLLQTLLESYGRFLTAIFHIWSFIWIISNEHVFAGYFLLNFIAYFLSKNGY